MHNTLFLILAQAQRYWKTGLDLSHLRFVGYRTLFGLKRFFQDVRTTTKSLLSLSKDIAGKLILIPLIAFAFQELNPYLIPWITDKGFTIAKGTYVTLLATFTSLGGLFIGLYYAAISAISGAIYAKVPNNLRDLLAQEQVGNAYMRWAAALTYFGICLLALHAIGREPVVLAMLPLLLGVGLTIVGFVRLGTRAFYLSDPTTLSGRLFEELRRCHRRVQAGSFRWSDESFQHNAHGDAQATVETLTTVAEVAEKESHLNGPPFADLCKNLMSFLGSYEAAKKTIPTNSLWYAKEFEFSDWYRTGDTETSIAHETADLPQPKRVSQPRWIESAMLPIVYGCLIIKGIIYQSNITVWDSEFTLALLIWD